MEGSGLVVIQRIDIPASCNQFLKDGAASKEGGCVKRRATLLVARVGIGSDTAEAFSGFICTGCEGELMLMGSDSVL